MSLKGLNNIYETNQWEQNKANSDRSSFVINADNSVSIKRPLSTHKEAKEPTRGVFWDETKNTKWFVPFMFINHSFPVKESLR